MDESTILGVNWLQNYQIFCKNPKLYVERRKVSCEEFCLDIMKDLYADKVMAPCKIHLLLMLQDQVSSLIEDESILEQIIGSLQGFNDTLTQSKENSLLSSQVLVAVTSVVLSWKHMNENIIALVVNLKAYLVNIVLSESKNHVIRTTACRCIEEIEIFFPGILKNEISALYTALQNPQLLPPQSYAVLLSLCLRNQCNIQMTRKVFPHISEQAILAVPRAKKGPIQHSKEFDLPSVVATIVELLPGMSSTSVYAVLKNLMYVMHSTPKLLPIVFKPYIYRLTMSSDVLYFHLAIDLWRTFQDELFSAQEEKNLLNQLLLSATHPALTPTHRLLYMDWLESLISKKDSLVKTIPTSSLHTFIPGPFDDCYTQEKKIQILSLYFSLHFQSRTCSDFLLLCLNGLKKQAICSSGMSEPASFFRSLYTIVSQKHNINHHELHKLIFDVISASPRLSPYVINFLKSVASECSERHFSNTMLQMLMEYIINCPMKQLSQNLNYFMLILEAAAVQMPNTWKPQLALEQLEKLLESTESDVHSWQNGHSIISACRTLLKCHDIEMIYHSLGELIHLLIKTSNDVDVQMLAKQYYAMLTSVPAVKVKSLLKAQTLAGSSTDRLTFVSGRKAGFLPGRSMQELQTPILQLNRMETTSESSQTINVSDKITTKEGVLRAYEDFINADNFCPVVKIPFLLSHVDTEDEKFNRLYCVLIKVTASVDCENMSDIEIPMLVKSEEGSTSGISVNVEFSPLAPEPLVLTFRVEFSCADGLIYHSNLPAVPLSLADLFSPFPAMVFRHQIPFDWKSELFKELWNKFKESDENRYCFSTFHCTKQNALSVMKEHWSPFFMGNCSEGTVYNIGICLAPHHHLLMKVSVQNDDIFVTAVSDNSNILPLVPQCFN